MFREAGGNGSNSPWRIRGMALKLLEAAQCRPSVISVPTGTSREGDIVKRPGAHRGRSGWSETAGPRCLTRLQPDRPGKGPIIVQVRARVDPSRLQQYARANQCIANVPGLKGQLDALIPVGRRPARADHW